jgi:hypothetical protein
MEIIRKLLCVVLSLLEVATSGWQDNLRPRMFLQPRPNADYKLFSAGPSDGSPATGELGVVLVDGSHLLVGGRNVVYKIGLGALVVKKTLDWSASEQDKSVCLVKGKSEASCQNYIMVLKKFADDQGRYVICGTNAYKPECREYVEDAGTYLMTKKSKGVGLCPYRYSTVQYITVQYNTVQYSTVQYSPVQYSTIQYNRVQYSTVQRS